MSRLLPAAALGFLFCLGISEDARAQYYYTPYYSTSWDYRVVGYRIPLIGRELNGMGWNGEVLEGQIVAAVSLSGATRDGAALHKLRLEGTRFFGTHRHGFLADERFLGVIFSGKLSNGNEILLRIDNIQRHPERIHRDVFLYEVSYETLTGWEPLCGRDEEGQPVPAIPLMGVWNYEEGTPEGGAHIDEPGSFTFACEDHVLAKCVTAGYKPWQRVISRKGAGFELRSLQPLHQACTRVLRADYCGDGVTHTVDNLWLNFYDDLKIRIDGDGWNLEAEWDEHGAVCVRALRYPDKAPWCLQQLLDPNCGDKSHFQQGTRIISEFEKTF